MCKDGAAEEGMIKYSFKKLDRFVAASEKQVSRQGVSNLESPELKKFDFGRAFDMRMAEKESNGLRTVVWNAEAMK